MFSSNRSTGSMHYDTRANPINSPRTSLSLGSETLCLAANFVESGEKVERHPGTAGQRGARLIQQHGRAR